MNKASKIAIFGSKGYLGKQLAFYFTQKGETCDGFDMPECDITTPTFWATFDPTQYKSILFFAGLTGTEKGFAEASKYVMVNEIGLLNLLNRLSPLGESAPKIIFPSSRLVYKGGSEVPLTEDAHKETKTVYAVNKLACEGYLAAYHNRFGIPYNVIRICVPYGNLISSEYSYGTVGFFLKQIAANKTITLYGGGTVKRTFTHVEDICSAVERMILFPSASGVYNVGGSDLSIFDAATIVAKANDARVVSVDWPPAALLLESGSTVFDAHKIHLDLGHTPTHDFDSDAREIKL